MPNPRLSQGVRRPAPYAATPFLNPVIAFDPKPFIRTFETAVDKLIAIRKEVQTKTEQMEKSVRVAEREYSKKMAALSKEFEVNPLIPYHYPILNRNLGRLELILGNGEPYECREQHSSAHR